MGLRGTCEVSVQCRRGGLACSAVLRLNNVRAHEAGGAGVGVAGGWSCILRCRR